MAVATVAPTLVGDTADVLGRRPVYMLTLSLYIGANITISLLNTYSALLDLRIPQALAISGMISPCVLEYVANLFRHLLRRLWGGY